MSARPRQRQRSCATAIPVAARSLGLFGSLALLAALALPAAAPAQEGAPPPPRTVLAKGPIRAGEPEEVLPAGAVVHVRLRSLGELLATVDGLVMRFVPESALPPELAALLKEPRPFLAFLGKETLGEALTPEAIARAFGLDAARSVTLTFYPDAPPLGFVLSLPMADAAALTALIEGAFRPHLFQSVDVGADRFYELAGTNPDLPERIAIGCSADRVYLAGDGRRIVEMAHPRAEAPRLARDRALSAALADAGAADLVLAASAAPFAPMLADLERYRVLPPEVLAEARATIEREVDERVRAEVDRRLRRFGFGWTEALDGLECVAVAGWEVLAAAILDEAKAVRGISVSLDLGETIQHARMAIASDRIDPARFARPLPLDEVRAALALLPGDRASFRAEGQAPPPAPGPRLDQVFVERLRVRFAERGLDPKLLASIGAELGKRVEPASLESRVRWSLAGSHGEPGARRSATHDTVAGYLEALFAAAGQPALPLTLVPNPTPGAPRLLTDHFAADAAAYNASARAADGVQRALFGGEPWLLDERRVRVEPAAGEVTRHVLEDVWRTKSGLLGYDEHELINRRFVLERAVGPYVFIQEDPRAEWLASAEVGAQRPVPPAVLRLLDALPAGASSVEVQRALPSMLALLEGLDGLEAAAHREVAAYLERAQAIIDGPGDGDARLAALVALDVPGPVRTLNCDKASGHAYAVLLGDLAFPRPRAVPVIRDLFADVAREADNVGGAALYTRVRPGVGEVGILVASDGLALVVRSTGNRLFRTYLGVPGGEEALRRAIAAPGDGDRRPHEAVVRNTTWDFLDR